jgi:hypothetical protein
MPGVCSCHRAGLLGLGSELHDVLDSACELGDLASSSTEADGQNQMTATAKPIARVIAQVGTVMSARICPFTRRQIRYARASAPARMRPSTQLFSAPLRRLSSQVMTALRNHLTFG